MSRKKSVNILLFTILWILLVFYLSGQTGIVSNRISRSISGLILPVIQRILSNDLLRFWMLNSILRNIAHFFVYSVLGAFVFKLINNIIRVRKHWVFPLSLGICFFIGVIDEIRQTFVPGRGSELSDLILNITGSTFGTALHYFFNKFNGKYLNK